MTSQVEIAKKFDTIADMALDKFRTSIKFELFRKLLSIRRSFDRLWFIRSVGPFLYSNRNKIASRDLEFFMTRDWTAQKRDWLEITRGHGNGLADSFERTLREYSRNKTK